MIMKNIYIVWLVAIALFSCYDDKRNDDYNALEGVEVVLPVETSNRSFAENYCLIRRLLLLFLKPI